MPLYTIHHSYPLSKSQKETLATQITALHARTFITPSLFVNVTFAAEDASVGNYFVAGTARHFGSNRIVGMLRTGVSREKADFDRLAQRLEQIWDIVVSEEGELKDGEVVRDGLEGETGQGGGQLADSGKASQREAEKRTKAALEKESRKEAKRLQGVFLYPMLVAREQGVVIPVAGEEAAWLQSNMDDFKDRAEHQGNQDFKNMIEEIETREDLKQLLKTRIDESAVQNRGWWSYLK